MSPWIDGPFGRSTWKRPLRFLLLWQVVLFILAGEFLPVNTSSKWCNDQPIKRWLQEWGRCFAIKCSAQLGSCWWSRLRSPNSSLGGGSVPSAASRIPCRRELNAGLKPWEPCLFVCFPKFFPCYEMEDDLANFSHVLLDLIDFLSMAWMPQSLQISMVSP